MNRAALETLILSENDQIAAQIRAALARAGALSLNFIGAPGAGKTSVLERTLDLLPAHTRAAVLTGDVQTEHDSLRLRRYGYPVRQIITGGVCHLDAGMVASYVGEWVEKGIELLLIENVGNLLCPAAHDLGEDSKIVVMSVPEGDDKPQKYPAIFRKADLMLLNKIDLLPHVPFDLEAVRKNVRQIHAGMEIIELSCTAGSGLERWLQWLSARMQEKRGSARSLGGPSMSGGERAAITKEG